ncbi:DnaJ domain-containing protein [Flammeovirga sp. MY04]|uniref:J domain-containing protein n=1 Tax=Flammeovirga sp. MY04 TaxID=1191459 RepID=UPI0008062CB3|nr:DnaJ domain-containing protein [Flammeovirga sp. MY04]ANQ48808.1 DnaJ domain-containing protein [Flammeovirga sp. MY04]
MRNYYDILGIDQRADKRQIKKAYLTLAKKYHPDLHGNDEELGEKFKEVNEAYETLSDDSKKFHYDHGLTSFTTFSNTPTPTEVAEEEIRTQRKSEVKEEIFKEKAKEKKSKKFFVPFTVGVFTLVVGGMISFFVQRQSKLAASTFEDATTNLELKDFNAVKGNIDVLYHLESPLLADIIEAGLYVQLNQSNEAIDLLEPKLYMINEEPKNIVSQAYLYLGIAYYQRKLGNKAVDYLEKSISYNNKNKQVYYWLGVTYSELNLNYQEAINALEKAKSVLGYENQSILSLGIAYQRSGQYNAAQDNFELLLFNPDFKKEANYYMGWNYFLSNKNTNKACLLWEKAAKMGSQEARYQVQRHCGN